MLVSVIVPVYNVAEYLERCVRSVLALHTPVEVILVDDGSADESPGICDRWRQRSPKIRVVHQENQGLSQARNRGIREARGDYLLFLDGDDFLDSEQTDRMLFCLDGSQKILMGCYRSYYPETDRYIPEDCRAISHLTGEIPMERFLTAIPPDGKSCHMIAPRFVVKRKWLLEQELLFYPGIYHEDEEWTQRLLCRGQGISVTGIPFYCYRRGRGGAITSRIGPKHIRDLTVILERSAQLLTRYAQDPVRSSYLRNRMGQLYFAVMLNLFVLPPDHRKAMLAVLRAEKPVCLPVLPGWKGRIAQLAVRVLGLPFACRLLGVVRALLGKEGGSG